MIHYLEILLIGIALSMDALAVSLTMSMLEGKNLTSGKIGLIALFFGSFQAFMPLIGWFGCNLLGDFITKYGYIPATLLLIGIGGKMIWDRGKTEKVEFSLWKLTLLAFATSIDALLVGVSFACLGRTAIYPDVALIGITTVLISTGGCFAGRYFSRHINTAHSELIGGLVLIGIGIKVLLFN